MLGFNFLELCAIALCALFTGCTILLVWLFGDNNCCGECAQGRRCRCFERREK